MARAHSITVDGTSTDWFTRAPLADDTGLVARNNLEHGEYIWRDRAGDERTAFATPDPRVDITQIRYTGTATDLHVLVKVASLASITTGDGAPQVQLAIDLDRVAGSGAGDFVAGADTQVANAARWEYLLQTRFGSANSSVAVWPNAAGPAVNTGSSAENADGTIELAVPWSALGLASAPAAFRSTVAVFRSSTDDTTKDTAGSDALDVVSDYGDPGTTPGTAAELGDGVVDYFADVSVKGPGEVQAPLVVSAFAANIPAPDADAEWIEVANATSAPLNIGAYKLGDATTPGAAEGVYTFPAGTILPAGGRYRVARSGQAFQNRFGALPNAEFLDTSAAPNMNAFALWAPNAPLLDDLGDEVVVLDGSNTTVDVVPYGTGVYSGVGTLPAPAALDILQRNPSLRDTDTANDLSTAACSGGKVWDGEAGTNNWFDQANWNNNTLPGATDEVCISNTAFSTINFSGNNATVRSVTSAEGFTIASGNTLTLTSTTQASSFASLTVAAGTLTGAANFDITGPFVWSGGTLSGTGATQANGGITMNGTTKVLGRDLLSNGDTTWSAGQVNLNTPATFVNSAGRTFDIQFDGVLTWGSGSDVPTFDNRGTLTKSAGAGSASIQVALPNSGTVSVGSGRIDIYQWNGSSTSTGNFNVPTGSAVEFRAGTFNLNPGSTITGSGLVEVSGATVNANGAYANNGALLQSGGTTNLTPGLTLNSLSVTGGTLNLATAATDVATSTLTQSSGTITGAGDVTVSGATTWSGGTMSGAGSTFANGGSSLIGTTKVLGRTLRNNGLATWSGGQFNLNSGGRLVNPSGSTFDIQTDGTMTWGSGSELPLFDNDGTVTKSGGTGSGTNIQVGLLNDGSLNVNSGRLNLYQWGLPTTSSGSFTTPSAANTIEFQSGTFNLTAASSLGSPGAVEVGGATVNVAGSYTPATTTVSSGTLNLDAPTNLATVNLVSGTLGGSADQTIANLNWTGGTLSANAATTKTTVTTSLLLGGTTKTLSRRTFNDNVPAATPTVWASGNFSMSSGAIFNLAGRLEAAGDMDWTGDSNQTINVLSGAVFAKTGPGSASPENTYIENTFNNDGAVLAPTGHLRILSNGSHSGPFTIGTGGVIEFEGGTQTSAGAITAGPALPAPTGLAATPFTTGGSLAPNTYFYKVTARNINGETIGSAETSAVVTTAAGRVSLTWNAVPGASHYRVYRGTASNAQSVFITATTNSLVDTGPATAGTVPTVNDSAGRAYFSGGNITLNGSYDVPTTWVGGGTHTFSGATTFHDLHVFGGTALLNRPNTNTEFLSQSAGTIAGTGQLTLLGPRASSWTGGTMSGTGTTRVPAGVTLSLTGSSVKDFHTSRVWRNEGLVTWEGSGSIRTGTGALLDNTGVFDVRSDANFNVDFGGTAQIANTGTFKKTAGNPGGDNVTDIGTPFDNDGTLIAQFGRTSLNGGDGPNASSGSYQAPSELEFGGGTHDLAAASSVTGAGTIFFTNSNVNVNGTYDVATTAMTGGTNAFNAASSLTDVLNLSGGTLTGTGQFTMEGPAPSSWTGGTMSGSGTTRVPLGVTFSLTGTNVKDFHSSRVWRNDGLVTWEGSGSIRTGLGALLDNTGVFDVRSDANFNQDFGGPAQITNTGTFKKTAGNPGGDGVTDIGTPFDNDGTLIAQVGRVSLNAGDAPGTSTGSYQVPAQLEFGGGTHDLDTSSSVTGAGSVFFTNSTVNVNGGYDVGATTITGGTPTFLSMTPVTDVLTFSGGTLTGAGRLTMEGPGASSWTGGTMTGVGTTRVGAGATLTLSGGTKDIHTNRTLRNDGTIAWTAGTIRTGTGALIDNAGLFDIQVDSTFNADFGGGSLLSNSGTLRKSAGNGTTSGSTQVANTATGTIDVRTGTLDLVDLANYNNGTKALTGGTYLVKSILRIQNGDIQTNAAKIVLDGAASRIQDRSGVPLDALRNFATNAAAGDFSIVNGRDLFAAGARGPNLTNLGTLRGTGTYFQNVTNSGTVAAGASPGILTVNGSYTQTATGTLEVEIAGTAVAGTDYDRLVVTGTATLAGTVLAKTLGGFAPVTGVGIDVVTAAVRSGTFALVTSNPFPLPGGLVPEARYDATTAKLFAVPGGGAADDSVVEAAGTKTVTVTLSGPSNETVTVDYATADDPAGKARAGFDYTARSGTLTFAPNDTSETIDIPITGDAIDEDDEWFLLNLSNPVHTVLSDTQAKVTILDDDAAPVVAVDSLLMKTEGTGGPTNFDVHVGLTSASEKTITVNYATRADTATDDADYDGSTGTVTFQPGDTSKTISIPVFGDGDIEFDEQFFVDLTSPVNATLGTSAGKVIIRDDDLGVTSALAIGDVSVTEGDTGTVDAAFVVDRVGSSSGPVTVDYATLNVSAGAGDYTPQADTLTFADGETSKTIHVAVVGDRLDESNETFLVQLSNPDGSSLSDANGVGTIVDDDESPVLSGQNLELNEDETLSGIVLGPTTDSEGDALTYQVIEHQEHGALDGIPGNVVEYEPFADYTGGDAFAVRAIDSAGNPSNVVVINVFVNAVSDTPRVADDTATMSEDGTIVVEALANDFDVDEGDDIHITKVGTAGATPHGDATISDEGGTQIRYTPDENFFGVDTFEYTVEDTEGLESVGTITVHVTAVNDAPVALDVPVTAQEDTAQAFELNAFDVEEDALTYEIVDGAIHGNLSISGKNVTYTPNANYNGGDTIRYRVKDGALNSATATVLISVQAVNDPPEAQDDDLNVGENASALVNVLGNDNDVDADTLTIQSTGDGAKGTTEVEAGKIRYFAGAGQTGPDSFDYTVSDGHGGTDTATVSVNILAGSVVGDTFANVDDAGVTEGDSGERVVDVVVRLSREATEPAVIKVSTNPGTASPGVDYTPLTDRPVTFATGEQQHSVQVKVLGDTLDEANEAFSVVVSGSTGAVVGDGVAQVVITDDDPLPSLSIGSANVTEGDSGSHLVSLPVTLSKASGKTVSVRFATADGTATQPSDYTSANGTLTFAPGETSKAAQIAIGGDVDVETDEQLSVQLSGPDEATIDGAAGTVTIVNDDSLLPQPPPPLPPPPPPAVPTADLAITMTGPATSGAGQAATYAIGVKNNGPDSATGVVVSDAIPPGLQLVSANVGSVACAGTEALTCTIGTLASGATAAVTVIATTLEPGVHTNTASVAGRQADPAAGNNSASATTRVPIPVVRTPSRASGCDINGTPGDDVLRGTARSEKICGRGGNDVILGRGGNDILLGGAGADRLFGGAGKDILKGQNGPDELVGGAGNDRLDGGRGRDKLAGEGGADYLNGSYGNDSLNGGRGRDRVLGGPGQDKMRRDPKDVTLGGPGSDRCIRAGVASFCP